ncbi:DUF11 domain-containing protein [Leptolyngbya sp. FACHB-261]|uniref:DUF11 domain-containing protein n=1 Tax=Leptolyngbya sp. FACHB-261 TaxID=2692806 RepID=UPI001688F581|nr:DUF11 domain-containing protein [Leptolyngbya sp. FACHB-261]MBD2101587.1 DUF11 domain-containing protein [Leptolyngbya sp. FACHB-261]
MRVRADFLERFCWLLAALVIGYAIEPTIPATAQDAIRNSARAGFTGTNIPPVDSNEVTTPIRVSNASLEIVKVGDRAAAEPGDTVLYRLAIRNTGLVALRDFTITDVLPLGLSFVSRSLQGSVTRGNTTTPVNQLQANASGRTVRITYADSLEPQQILNVVYAAVVTPDAIRGTGRNAASVVGKTPNGREVPTGPVSHLLRIRSGILSECGTLIGRVFVDKNFDGEQQPGEAGVPNAVIFMDDGNRITTDPNGLFSLANVIAGSRTGTLDLSSLPGYTLAPNLYRIERNSQSRLVRLSPGGLARMNFAVTPTFGEGQRPQ